MDMEILLAVVGLSTLIIGYAMAYFLQQSRIRRETEHWGEKHKWLERKEEEVREALNEKETENIRLLSEREELREGRIRMEEANAELRRRLEQQKVELQETEKRLQEKFENLANKILEDKSNRFTAQNQKNIKQILEPLHTQIRAFEEKVTRSRLEQAGLHSQLRQQLETLQQQNLRITQEAQNLTRALKGDNKLQGNWGELVLEKILEKSGLEKDREYSLQQSLRDEHGRRQVPDVIIHLPDGKKMIVDAKVSLNAYERYVNAEDEEGRKLAAREHLDSVKRHIQQLSDKKYEDLYSMDSPDFVLMFVPMEPAFAIALQQDPNLFGSAFERNIVVVTPTTLLATLKTIDSMWTNEKQRLHAVEIARVAGSMYDKFVGFYENLEGLGRKMDLAKQEYIQAMSRLKDGKGSLVRSAERLKNLGAKAKKSLPDSILERANEPTQPNE